MRVKTFHQARAVRSAERFAAAAARLMRRKSLADVSVAEIVASAGLSVGAFYARFASKDAFIDWLCERRLASEEAKLARRLEALEQRRATLRAIVEAYVDGAMSFFASNVVLLREIVMMAARAPTPAELPATRRASADADQVFVRALRSRCTARGGDDAIDFTFMTVFVASMLRVYLLFPEMLPAAERRRSRAALRRELVTWVLRRIGEP